MVDRSLIVLVCVGATLLAGCRGPALTPGPVYPESAARYGVLDIQVRVESRRVSFTNTTPRVLPAGRLWINGWYSAAVKPTPVGGGVEIPITAFRDEHGEGVRGGGFFAAEEPEKIILAELEAPDGLYGLVVVRE